MSPLNSSDFRDFFRALYGCDPFPWQERLARRVCGSVDAPGNWPLCITLPTAAGKTACIDIAVFALACQAPLPAARRTAARRVFFVVDRRVVVDQAYQHAERLSLMLCDATGGILRRVASALRSAGADEKRPLDYYALRGGMYRESAWVRSPLQPTIITSTVDQVGSRLLFRGYGVSDASKPLHAALVGNDALILLDEAHCAAPFMQTMELVNKYRAWADEPLRSPFAFVTMTATPSHECAPEDIERLGDADMDSPLGDRVRANKPATLVVAAKAKGAKWRVELVKELVRHACALHEKDGFAAVGVIVNRVATARETAAALRDRFGEGVDVVLLTGRMRPLDRDAVVARLAPLLSGSAASLARPTFVVATQTLEVGADLDFHALVTECASLDALRQRFGRLNRIAVRPSAKAVVVVRGDQAQDSEDDPVYGASLADTWKWLANHGDGVDEEGRSRIDFGVESIGRKWDATPPEKRPGLLAPAPDAAVLLPAHCDMWCQTSPRPVPDPDPSYFLHGPDRGSPEVQVVFRADLGDDPDGWAEIVSLCPPSSSETLPVRLGLLQRWLREVPVTDDRSDVQGEQVGADDESGEEVGTRRALRWRGPESCQTGIVGGFDSLVPGDVYVLPNSASAKALGDFPGGTSDDPITDAGDAAFQRSRDIAMLRLRSEVYPALASSFDELDRESMDDAEIEAKVAQALDLLGGHQDEAVRRAAERLARPSARAVKWHPRRGIVLVGRRRLRLFDPTFAEPEESWDASCERPYPLVRHGADVAEAARTFAEQAGLGAHAGAIELAGLFHDAGKADPRFQAWLHGGRSRVAAAFGTALAKSVGSPLTGHQRAIARERAAYPAGGRHELLSVRFAGCDGALPAGTPTEVRELVLHLIAAHHGHCRPFAPVVIDANPVQVSYGRDGRVLVASSATGLERVDSGVAERFWRLTRRFGWWGLPWLEAMLRLADWRCGAPSEQVTAAAKAEVVL